MNLLIFSQVFIDLSVAPDLTTMVYPVNVKLGSSYFGEVEVPEDTGRVIDEAAEALAGGSKVQEARYAQVWDDIVEDERIKEEVEEGEGSLSLCW